MEADPDQPVATPRRGATPRKAVPETTVTSASDDVQKGSGLALAPRHWRQSSTATQSRLGEVARDAAAPPGCETIIVASDDVEAEMHMDSSSRDRRIDSNDYAQAARQGLCRSDGCQQ